ncbi:MAG: M28 family peptidase, partial [Bacteroidota bacterium]
QRGIGASKASEYGAVGMLVRSMTTRLDDVPHTGAMGYQDGVDPIPAMAISTNDAELLSRLLKNETVRVFMRANCVPTPPAISYNVIGEIRGGTYPDEIILVGGHLDSWDVGEGAHDDGAGTVHAMAVIELLRRMDYQPQRTIRCVLFMNEESGLGGARAYW